MRLRGTPQPNTGQRSVCFGILIRPEGEIVTPGTSSTVACMFRASNGLWVRRPECRDDFDAPILDEGDLAVRERWHPALIGTWSPSKSCIESRSREGTV